MPFTADITYRENQEVIFVYLQPNVTMKQVQRSARDTLSNYNMDEVSSAGAVLIIPHCLRTFLNIFINATVKVTRSVRFTYNIGNILNALWLRRKGDTYIKTIKTQAMHTILPKVSGHLPLHT